MPTRRCVWPTVDRCYRRLMAKLGYCIGVCPLPFLLTPLCLCLSLVYPFLDGLKDYKKFAVTRAGAIELFTPADSWAQNQKLRIESYFADGGYFADRTVISPTLLILLISAKNGGTVLRQDVSTEYSRLRAQLETLAFMYNNTVYDYKRMCGGDEVKCQPDPYMTLMRLQENGILRYVSYPFVNFSRQPTVELGNNLGTGFLSQTEFYIGPLFGGVDVDPVTGRIIYAKFVRLILNVPRPVNVHDEGLLNALGRSFVDFVTNYRSDVIDIDYWASLKYIEDMQLISRRVVKLLPFLVGLLLLFALWSCCMRDCVLSQPWLAVCGVISACLGVQVGYSLLFLLRVQLIEIAMIVPFLVLSIGVDDTFVMLSVWRQTDINDDVPTRLSRTFADAAVSITITSVTDVAAFLIGISSVFPSVRIFCSFSACTLAAMFLFQITFFGACMVYTGRREAAGRHCLSFNKVSPISEKDGLLKRLFCYSSVESEKAKPSYAPVKPFLTVFFEGKFSTWVVQPKTKLAVALTYALYIGGAVYCLATYMVLGLQVSNLVPYNSDTHKYLTLYETYFTKCSTSAEIVIPGKLRYDDPVVQKNLIKMARKFEFTEFTYKADFWLLEFVDFTNSLRTPITNLTFYRLLNDVFLPTSKFRKYRSDIKFSTRRNSSNRIYANSSIEYSRFYVQLINMGYRNRSKAMHLLKNIADAQPYSLLLYDVSFPLAEQYDSILTGAVIDIVVGVGCMLISALIFVPDILNCACIAFTVFSINLGVLGYMAVCGIHLDIVSLITILLCVGFSVDYSAHVAYHYYTVESDETEEKVRKALGTAGAPILQSSLSMMIGVLTAIGVRAYISDTFVTTVCLVMVIGVYHSLIVLPVMLSVVVPGTMMTSSTASDRSDMKNRFVKPDPVLKFKFDQMQRQKRAESWTRSRRDNNVTTNYCRPVPLQIRPMESYLDVYDTCGVGGATLSTVTTGCDKNVDDVTTMSRRNFVSNDMEWLKAWIHGDMPCSRDKGKYCAYCEIVDEIRTGSTKKTNHLRTKQKIRSPLALKIVHSCKL